MILVVSFHFRVSPLFVGWLGGYFAVSYSSDCGSFFFFSFLALPMWLGMENDVSYY